MKSLKKREKRSGKISKNAEQGFFSSTGQSLYPFAGPVCKKLGFA
jgi:hypothetical protein